MGNVMLGMITAGVYSAAHHDPTTNRKFVAAFEEPPNLRACVLISSPAFAYDGMDLIYRSAGKDQGQCRRNRAWSRR